MAKTTGISWTDATWNPHYGCRKVSKGCAKCYAERDMKRFGKDFSAVTVSKTTYLDPIKWWKNKSLPIGSKIFTCSLSDFFIEESDEWRDELWGIIKQTPYIYLILTKRPERIKDHLPKDWNTGYPNVYLGVTVEEDRYADRVRILNEIPAIIRFISYEPATGPLDVRDMAYDGMIDWLIGGGESDPTNPRVMDTLWMRRVQQNCAVFKIPFFFKQIGGKARINGVFGGDKLEGIQYHEFPELKDETKKFLADFIF